MEEEKLIIEFRVKDGVREVRMTATEDGQEQVIDWTEESVLISVMAMYMMNRLDDWCSVTIKDIPKFRNALNELRKS